MSDRQIIVVVLIAVALILPPSIYFATRRTSEPAPMSPLSDTPQTPAPGYVERPKPTVAPMPPKPAATKPAPVQMADVKITGGAWIIRKGGQSDVLRGLEVSLLKGKVPAAKAREVIALRVESLEKLAAHYRQVAKERPVGGHWTEQIKVYDRELAKAKTFAESLPDEVDPEKAIGGLTASNQIGLTLMQDIVRATQLVSVNTNIDGKFSLSAEVPHGDYYLHAELDSAAGLVKWLIPLTIKSDTERSIDLFNGSASLIINASERESGR